MERPNRSLIEAVIETLATGDEAEQLILLRVIARAEIGSEDPGSLIVALDSCPYRTRFLCCPDWQTIMDRLRRQQAVRLKKGG